jgi:hypothetical protein
LGWVERSKTEQAPFNVVFRASTQPTYSNPKSFVKLATSLIILFPLAFLASWRFV